MNLDLTGHSALRTLGRDVRELRLGGRTIWHPLSFVGAVKRTLTVAGRTREYYLYRPPGMVAPAASIMQLHGGNGAPDGIFRLSGMKLYADTAKVAIILPKSAARQWNDGRPESDGPVTDADFLLAAKADCAARGDIDPARCVLAGHSSGGLMTIRMSIEQPAAFRGFAVVSASIPTALAAAAAASPQVNTILFHGVADALMPYDGGPITQGEDTGVGGTVAGAVNWRTVFENKLGAFTSATDGPIDNRTDGTTLLINRRVSNADPTRFVRLYRINNGNHSWPGGAPRSDGGTGFTSFEVFAAQEIINVFGLGSA